MTMTSPQPITGSPRPRSRRLAVAASALVWLAGTPGPLAIFAAAFAFAPGSSTDVARVVLTVLLGSLVVMLLATTAAGVVVLVWLWRAWEHAAARAPQRWSQGWVVAAWFVPVLSLWVPLTIVSDIARASLHPQDPDARRVRTAMVIWWTGWLGMWPALSVAVTGLPIFDVQGLGAVYRWYAVFAGLSALLSIVAAAAFTVFALRIADRQDAAAPPPAFPGPGFPGPAAPAGSRPTPRWMVPAVLGGVALLITGTGVALVLTEDDPPAEVVAAAVADARTWNGANYRGSAPVPGATPVEFDITVTATGARGTLSRQDGARAEVVQDGTGVLVKGNREWWTHSYPDRAEQLADRWLSDAGAETVVVDHILRLDPASLEREVNPDLGPLWEGTGEQVVDGEQAIVLSSGFLVLVVTADEPYRLLSIEFELEGGPESGPVRVTAVDAGQAAEVDAAVTRVRAESPRPFVQQLMLRPQADVQVQPESFCTNPTCTATFTVTNTGEIPITGRFEMSADGMPAGTGRVDLQPGESVTFSGSAPNRLYDSPGATGQIYWLGRIIPD